MTTTPLLLYGCSGGGDADYPPPPSPPVLNPAFNGDGYTSHDSAAGGSGDDYGEAVAIDTSGKVVIAGYSMNSSADYDMALWRYNSDGTLDSTFNGTGYVTHNSAAGGGGNDYGYAVALDTDGKIVVAGYSLNLNGDYDMTLWRYNSDGTPDTAFNGTGIVTHDNAAGGGSHDFGLDMAIDRNGKIVVTGSSVADTISAFYNMTLWRYNSDGTLDSSFNGTGIAVHDSSVTNKYFHTGRGLVIDSNGKIIVTGDSRYNYDYDEDMTLWRYNNDGTLDTTFNDTGIITERDYGNYWRWCFGNDVTIGSDGLYYAVGSCENYTGTSSAPTDSLDPTVWLYVPSTNGFDIEHQLYTSVYHDEFQAVTAGTNGAVYATGNLAVKRADGSMTYDMLLSVRDKQGNYAETTHDNAAGGLNSDRGNAVAIDGKGNIYIAGFSKNSNDNNDMAVWCYQPQGDK